MNIIQSLLGIKAAPVSSSDEWPRDLGPWGKYENDPARFVYDLLLEEYRASREDVRMWTRLMNGLLTLVLTFWAASFALVQIALPKGGGVPAVLVENPWILLSLTLLGAAPGFTFVMWDIRSAQLSNYIQQVLKNRFASLILSRSSQLDPFMSRKAVPFLDWEPFYEKVHTGLHSIIYFALIYVFSFSMYFAGNLLYGYLAISRCFAPTYGCWALLSIDLFMLIGAVSGVAVARGAYTRLVKLES